MSVSGVKSCAKAGLQRGGRLGRPAAGPISAASTAAARFGMPAMPPKAMRAARHHAALDASR